MAILQAHPACQVVAVVDPNAHKISGLDKEGIKTFSSLDAFFVSGLAVDVAIIATPNGVHCAQAIKCLEFGLHVLIEKPMGISTQECDRVVLLSQAAGKTVFVVKQNRFSPIIQWLHKLRQGGALGQVYAVHVNCFWNRDHRYYQPGGWRGTKLLDGGVLFTQFSHFIDILYWTFGDIHNITSRFYNHNHQLNTEFPDSGSVCFQFTGGAQGSLNFTTSVYGQNMESSITVIAQNGSLKIGGQYMNNLEYCHIKDTLPPQIPPSAPPNDYGAYQGSASNHHFVIQNVVDTLNGQATATTSAQEGMKVVDIIERIYQSSSLD